MHSYFFRTVFLKLSYASESSGYLVKIQMKTLSHPPEFLI